MYLKGMSIILPPPPSPITTSFASCISQNFSRSNFQDYIVRNGTSLNVPDIIIALCNIGAINAAVTTMSTVLSYEEGVKYLIKEGLCDTLTDMIVGVTEKGGCYVEGMEEILWKRDDVMEEIVRRGKGRRVIENIYGNEEGRTKDVFERGDCKEVRKSEGGTMVEGKVF